MNLLHLGTSSPRTTRPPRAAPASDTLRMAPWTLLCPEDTVLVRADDHRRLRVLLSTLRSGDRIGFVDGRMFSRWRLRRLATSCDVLIERELIVLPTLVSPIVVVDDTETSVGYLWDSVATVPPGMARTALPAAAALALVRVLPWSWTGALAPGRVVVGRVR